jgi:predicted PurR-regulated permease PerM
MENGLFTKVLTAIIIIAVFVVSLFILKPILLSIIIALLAAYIFRPVYQKIRVYIKEKNTATAVLIILIILIFIIPVWFLTPLMIRQGFETYTQLQKIDLGNFITESLSFIPSQQVLTSFSAGINNFVTQSFNSFLKGLTDLIVNFSDILLKFTVFIFVFYFAIRDADKLKEYVIKMSPFSSSTEKELIEEFRKITNAVVYGQFLIGVIQGIMLGLGLFILGVPNSLVLTFAAVAVSIIPVLGSWLIWLPVSIFLLVSGNIISGIILLLYGALFVSVIDNVLRLFFLSKSSNLNIPLSVVGIIGGLYTFGIIGLVLGPLIICYMMVFINLYKDGKLHDIFKR